ncbi:NACHT, LRR and PYD domains-containing protein 12-like [Onychostoma macrolepis]|uniref:NACHT, LRR and PYD domains-containing protein 12-like n=1 Tax=Onychostoma macrolepis TaxID=369639 RepID=UPI00272D1A38|nr:NACHT, LRR and PYD domains-containing protein 12-like [Onychostoma macrolepis]XP_058636131.1 NACHT, LRR and PYD domains-containing protein 12-like [Onychostoma macrolepis]
MASVSELLYKTLDDLEQGDLKRFRSLLKQDKRIGAGKLQNADATDIVDMMVDSYGPEEAVKITLNILSRINQNHLAEELQNKYTEVQKSLEAAEKHTRKQDDFWLQEFLKTHKMNMKEKVEHIFDNKKEKEVHLKDIYTELFITQGDIKEVNNEHEFQQIDNAFKICKSQDRPIKYNDVFSLNKNKKKKFVLTKGIAGIGKTISVHKFILDWAEGKANEDIECVFLLPFRKINCIKDREICLHQFLQRFNPELKDLETTRINKIYSCKLAFVFDGLDESRLTLDFDSGMATSVKERSSVDELFTSLVNGTLLPSALVWVTSRPAAANQIPPEYVGLFTEVRGFTDQQKEEYFRKRIKDETQASRIISHIKKSRSLYIMCYIPVFCWITATVLQDILIGNNAETINTTLTEMYIHFLLIQMNMKSQKHDRKTERERTKLLDSNKTMILKLAKLAFEQLKKENIVFYEEDLKACGINLSEDFESTGMLTEIFQQEAGLHEMKVFCFVHLSVQEFLAAVHVFLCFLDKNIEELQFFFEETQNRVWHKRLFLRKSKRHKIQKNIQMHDLLNKAVKKAMQSQKGHLDLFLRFLMGISLESSQKLLKGLLSHTEDSKDSIIKTTEHVRELLQQDISPETSVNLFYCLLELNDHTLYMQIQKNLRTLENILSPSMCSLLAYVLLMSEEVLDEFNLFQYSLQGHPRRLLPAVRCCRKAVLLFCDLDETCCETVTLALQIPNSPMIELDMSGNDLLDSGVKHLSDGLKSPNCQLEKLRLWSCKLTGQCCEFVASALQSSNSHLTELIISENKLQDSGVKLLSDGLKSPNCQLEKLSLSDCKLTGQCCEFVASALQSSNSRLIELNMSENELKDSGVKLLSDGLKSPNCQLEKLRLHYCKLTGECCEFVASALQSSNSHLIELDMSRNELQDSGVKLLSDGLKSPNCQLQILSVADCKLTGQCCETVASNLQSSNFHLIKLDMSRNELQDSGVKLLSDGLKSPNCQLEKLSLSHCKLTGQCCEFVASVLQSSNSRLIELNMSENKLQDSGVKLLSDGLKSPNCQLKILSLLGCKLTGQCCEFVASVLQSSNSRLIDLNMSENKLQDSGVKLLSDGLKSPNCQLEILRLSSCKVTDTGFHYLASALHSNPSHLRKLDLGFIYPYTSGLKMLDDLRNNPNCALNGL